MLDDLPLSLLQRASTIAIAHDLLPEQQPTLLNLFRAVASQTLAISMQEHSSTRSEDRLQLCTAVNEWQLDSRHETRFKKAFIITGTRESTRYRADSFNQFDSAVEKLLINGRTNNTVTLIDSNSLRLPYRFNVTLLFVLLPNRNADLLFRTWLRPYFVDIAAFNRVLGEVQNGFIVFDLSFNGNRQIYRFGQGLGSEEAAGDDWQSFTVVKTREEEKEEADICSICLEPYEKGVLQRVLRCQHIFHKECFDSCVAQQLYCCAICSQPVQTATNRHALD